jgi:hypothetical protein
MNLVVAGSCIAEGNSGPTRLERLPPIGSTSDLGNKAHRVTIIGVDDNPVSLPGVKALKRGRRFN